MKRHKVNFFAHIKDKEECKDEISSLGWKHCIDSVPFSSAFGGAPSEGLHY